jgi:hypothetical protein
LVEPSTFPDIFPEYPTQNENVTIENISEIINDMLGSSFKNAIDNLPVQQKCYEIDCCKGRQTWF